MVIHIGTGLGQRKRPIWTEEFEKEGKGLQGALYLLTPAISFIMNGFMEQDSVTAGAHLYVTSDHSEATVIFSRIVAYVIVS